MADAFGGSVMGADGGICWVEVRDRPAFERLTSHLVMDFDTKIWSNWVAFLKLKDSDPRDLFIRTYADPPIWFQLYDMLDLIKDLRTPFERDEWLEKYWIGNLTWTESVVSFVTEPPIDWPGADNITCLLPAAANAAFLGLTDDFLEYTSLDDVERMLAASTHQMANVKLVDWANDLARAIDVDSYQELETWT